LKHYKRLINSFTGKTFRPNKKGGSDYNWMQDAEEILKKAIKIDEVKAPKPIKKILG